MRKPIIAYLLLFFFVFATLPGMAVATDIDRLEVTAVKTTLAPGETVQATATLYYTDGSSADVTGQVTWQSQDISIATVTNTGLITGQDLDDKIWSPFSKVFIDAIYTTPDFAVYSGQIEINPQESLLDYTIFPDSKLSIIIGQEIKIRAKNKAGLIADDINIEYVNGNGATMLLMDNNIKGFKEGFSNYDVSFADGSKQRLTIYVCDTDIKKWGSAAFSLYYAGSPAINNAPEGQEDDFFAQVSNKWTVDPNRTEPPWTVLSNPGGAEYVIDSNIGSKTDWLLNFWGFDKGIVNIYFESEPGSFVTIPGEVSSPIINKSVFNVTHIRGTSPDSHRCYIPLTITAPVGEAHRARVVVELWDDGNMMFRGHLPLYIRAIPRVEPLQFQPLKADGSKATLSEIKAGIPVTLRWHPYYFCNANTVSEATVKTIAPGVVHEWKATLSGLDENMNYVTVPIPGFSGIDENGVLQIGKSILRTKTGTDGIAEVRFTFDPALNTLKYSTLHVASQHLWPDTWKLIMPTTGSTRFEIWTDLKEQVIPPTTGGGGNNEPEVPIIPDPEPPVESEPETPVIPEKPEIIVPTLPQDNTPTPATVAVTKPAPKPIPVIKPSPTGTVKGVLKMRDGRPLANARLELHSKPRVTYTDSKGYFEFTNVPLGSHKLYLADLRITDEKILIKTLQVSTSDKDKHFPITKTVKNLETTEIALTEDAPNKTVEMIVDYELPKEKGPEKKKPIWPWLLLLLPLLLLRRRRKQQSEN